MSEPPGAAVSLAEAPQPTDTPSPRLAAQRVLPLRRPGRWIATAVVLVLAAQFVHGLVSNPFYQWDRFGYWFLRPTILDGLLITLEVAAYSALLGLLGGVLLALARLSRSPVLRLPSGAPPLGFVGDDQKTITGSEPDLGRLVAAVFGLEPEVRRSTWENLFIGLDSGKVDVGFSNITDTEERKQKYEFASYRKDDLAFEVKKDNTWKFDGDYESLAGKTVSVGNGTNQEKLLLEWKAKLAKEGKKPLTVKYFQETSSIYLALSSGKIDAYFGPNPNLAYHVAKTATNAPATRIAGQFSGAGETLQGLIAATAKKDSGLAMPRRRHQLPDRERPVRPVAQGLEPLQRRRRQVRGQPARAASRQLLNGCSISSAACQSD
ncbi:hypothetical protein SALBM311S_11149 [Streptomyces alboniger]